IHAEQDHILPFHNGQELYDASGSKDKTFLSIPNANHNDIFLKGLREYMEAVRALVSKAVIQAG
ncbi:MAG: alpha/beta hydrolase, partial [Deltaproteobacteria bacterium]|nr:alpha/beta hydrolase [Deltaproteobacteria bacterium]